MVRLCMIFALVLDINSPRSVRLNSVALGHGCTLPVCLSAALLKLWTKIYYMFPPWSVSQTDGFAA